MDSAENKHRTFLECEKKPNIEEVSYEQHLAQISLGSSRLALEKSKTLNAP